MRHDRSPGHPDDDFLIPAEPAIGDLITAATNRTKSGWRPASAHEHGRRTQFGLLGGLLFAIVGCVVAVGTRTLLISLGAWQLTPFEPHFAITGGLGGGIAGVALGVALAYFTRRPSATFVGKAGLQEYSRGLLFGPKAITFRFDDAAELKVQRIRHFVNGVYTGTRFDYTWRDAGGKVLHRIVGQYRDDRPIDGADRIAFAQSAENAWTHHRIAHFDREIARHGVARFRAGRDWVGIGKGFLEIGQGDRSQRIQLTDIPKQIYFQQGVLVIKQEGAKEGWFSSEGVFRFPVAALADFQVFLVVLREQTGIQFN